MSQPPETSPDGEPRENGTPRSEAAPDDVPEGWDRPAQDDETRAWSDPAPLDQGWSSPPPGWEAPTQGAGAQAQGSGHPGEAWGQPGRTPDQAAGRAWGEPREQPAQGSEQPGQGGGQPASQGWGQPPEAAGRAPSQERGQAWGQPGQGSGQPGHAPGQAWGPGEQPESAGQTPGQERGQAWGQQPGHAAGQPGHAPGQGWGPGGQPPSSAGQAPDEAWGQQAGHGQGWGQPGYEAEQSGQGSGQRWGGDPGYPPAQPGQAQPGQPGYPPAQPGQAGYPPAQPGQPGYRGGPGRFAADSGAPGGGGSQWAQPGFGGPEPAAPAGWGGYAQPAGWGAPAPGWGHAAPGWAMQRPKPGIIPLRPISLTEIYDGAFQAIRTNPRTMIGISAIVIAVTAVLASVPEAAALVSIGQSDVFDPDRAGEVTTGEIVSTFSGLLSSLLVPTLIQWLATTVVSGMLIIPVSNAVLGRKTTPGALWQRTRGRIWALIGLALLILVASVGLVLLLLVPGLIAILAGAPAVGAVLLVLATILAVVLFLALFYSLWALAPPALLLEDLSVLAALRRSWRLARRSFWRVLGIMFLTAVLVGILAGVISLPFAVVSSVLGLLQDQPYASFPLTLVQLLVGQIGDVISGAFLYPLTAAVTALLYIDLRMRTEGLDVELMRATGDAPA